MTFDLACMTGHPGAGTEAGELIAFNFETREAALVYARENYPNCEMEVVPR